MRDRRSSQPHHITLYKHGVQTGSFTIPQTDPRFVKGDDLFQMAYDRIIEMCNRPSYARRHNDPSPNSWTTFEFHWSMFKYVGNAHGERIE